MHNDQMCTTTTILPTNTFSEPEHHVALQRTTASVVTSNAVSKRTFEQSPGNSPHKVGKIGPKRPRTIEVRQFTSSLVKDIDSSATQRQHMTTLTMEDFEESSKEGDEQLLISHKLFSYIAMKYVAHC